MRRIVPRWLWKRALLFKYRGNHVECPCCGGTFRTFWPSGVNNKPNTLCPKCNSLERHRLLWLYLAAEVDLDSRPLKLLHVAPEPIFASLLSGKVNIDYLSADLESPPAMVRMDLTDIDRPDDTFDAILCSHVLEHIPDDARAMSELYRVLRPGGWAILQHPVDNSRATTYEDFSVTDPAERERHFGQVDHVRVYGRNYADRLRLEGFIVQVVPYPRMLGTERVKRFALQEDEDVYLCTKSDGSIGSVA